MKKRRGTEIKLRSSRLPNCHDETKRRRLNEQDQANRSWKTANDVCSSTPIRTDTEGIIHPPTLTLTPTLPPSPPPSHHQHHRHLYHYHHIPGRIQPLFPTFTNKSRRGAVKTVLNCALGVLACLEVGRSKTLGFRDG